MKGFSIYNMAVGLLLAVIILLIGGIIGKIFEKAMMRILHELEVNILIKRCVGYRVLVEEAISKAILWFVYITSFVIALSQLGIETLVLNILIGGIIIFVLIGVLLAVKDFIPNTIGGIVIRQRAAFKEGDSIKVKDIDGKVKSISLIQTILETKNGDMIYIPNATLVKELFWKKKK